MINPKRPQNRKQAPNRQHTVSISLQQTIVTAAHHSAPRQASRWMRAEPLISRDTHASLGVVPYHGGRSDALQDNEPAMTEVPKPLLCTVKWGVDGVIGGVLHLRAVADIHAEDRIWGRWLANSACEHVQSIRPRLLRWRECLAAVSECQRYEHKRWRRHSYTLSKSF